MKWKWVWEGVGVCLVFQWGVEMWFGNVISHSLKIAEKSKQVYDVNTGDAPLLPGGCVVVLDQLRRRRRRKGKLIDM